jgi:hypothetical protein
MTNQRWLSVVNRFALLRDCATVWPEMATPKLFSQLDRLLSTVEEAELEAGLGELERRRITLEERRGEIDAQMSDVDNEIARAREFLELKRRWATTSNGRGGAIAADIGRLRGRRAILTVMRERPRRIWAIPEVHEVLLERGWVDGEDTHTTQVNMSRLYRERKLRKHGTGRYLLPEYYEELRKATLIQGEEPQ